MSESELYTWRSVAPLLPALCLRFDPRALRPLPGALGLDSHEKGTAIAVPLTYSLRSENPMDEASS
jgi:hypothetical protein